jgi:hypothetical protein
VVTVRRWLGQTSRARSWSFKSGSRQRLCALTILAALRWPEGFVCPGCGGRSAWVLERRHLWQCSECALQTSVTAGTVMHKTRTPLRTWFWAAYLVATHHPGISAKQLQRQLGLSRYETAWLILQKLRRAMIAPERASHSRTRGRDRRVSSSGDWKKGAKAAGSAARRYSSASQWKFAAAARDGYAYRSWTTPRPTRYTDS